MGALCCSNSSAEEPAPAQPANSAQTGFAPVATDNNNESGGAATLEDVPVEVQGQSGQRNDNRLTHSSQQGPHKAEVRTGVSYAQAIKHTGDANHVAAADTDNHQAHNQPFGGASTSQASATHGQQYAGGALHPADNTATSMHATAVHAPQPLFGTLLVDRSWKTIHGKVVSVADGDTVDVLDAGGERHRIRMAFSDAPETKQEYGPESKAALNAQIYKEIVTVYIADTDQYQRVVGVVVKDATGEDMNLSQILHGNAWFYSFYSAKQPKAMRDAYSQAEAQARAAKRGLWAASNPENPRQWRIAHPRDDK
jgi:endonuclease YncB( thermonuclease family)